MSGRAPSPAPHVKRRLPAFDIIRGVLRLASGHRDGLAMFGSSPAHFTASLAPFIALPLVGTALVLLQTPSLNVVGDLLATWCALLAPAVITWELARRWQREALWLRYATAFNWCMWAVPLVAFLLLLLIGVLISLGLPDQAAAVVLPLGLGAYGLWLHWFLARNGLNLSLGRAVLVVVLVNAATSALVMAPVLVSGLIS